MRVSLMREVLNHTTGSERFSANEIKYVRHIDVNEFRKQADSYARQLRELDLKIQKLNWTIDLVWSMLRSSSFWKIVAVSIIRPMAVSLLMGPTETVKLLYHSAFPRTVHTDAFCILSWEWPYIALPFADCFSRTRVGWGNLLEYTFDSTLRQRNLTCYFILRKTIHLFIMCLCATTIIPIFAYTQVMYKTRNVQLWKNYSSC